MYFVIFLVKKWRVPKPSDECRTRPVKLQVSLLNILFLHTFSVCYCSLNVLNIDHSDQLIGSKY